MESNKVPKTRSLRPARSLFRTPQGQLIPVSDLLGDRIVEEILQRVEDQRNEPRYIVSQLEVLGDIDQDELRLKIDLQIQVNSVKEYGSPSPSLLVMLYLASPPNPLPLQRMGNTAHHREQNTQQWHLKGKGLHTVTMELVGKREPYPPVSRRSASIFRQPRSHMRLFGSATPLTFGSCQHLLLRRPQGMNRECERSSFLGPGPGFGMTWSQVVSRVTQKPVIQVQNRMKLDLNDDSGDTDRNAGTSFSGSPVSEIQVTFFPPVFNCGSRRSKCGGVSS